MTYNEIRKMAKGLGINTFKMKKTDIVGKIQQSENNIECYAAERIQYCDEQECLWRKDCFSLNSNAKASAV